MKEVLKMTRLATSTATIIDPVCGMNVLPGNTALVVKHDGSSYYFCAEGCRKAFEEDPEKYLTRRVPKRKGFWRRYLDRLNRATGGKELKCCH